ncbi:unnamed protein product [Tenebrio molitor]|nr:unnamed protein product [Tenebrio molitor]
MLFMLLFTQGLFIVTSRAYNNPNVSEISVYGHPHERTPLFNGHSFIVPISEIGNLVYRSLS